MIVELVADVINRKVLAGRLRGNAPTKGAVAAMNLG
jgi:hypothetical protein